MNWLRSPLAILAQAMIASALCGLFLHPQGFLLTVGLGAVVAVGLCWPRLSLHGVTGSLSFERTRTREGEPVKAMLSVRNCYPWGAWGLAVHAGFRYGPTRRPLERPDASVSFAPGWRTTEASWHFLPACRGEYPVSPPLITSGFPFGLSAARRELATGGKLLVWPKTFPVGPIPLAAEGRNADGLALRDKPGTWGDLLGVRPYRRGDSLRRIHWPQTARHGQIVVCEVQAGAVPRIQVVLDTHPDAHVGAGPDGSREWAIRVAASFAESWIKQGAEVGMVIKGCAVAFAGASTRVRSAAALDALARLEPGNDLDLATVLSLPECRRCDRGLRVIVTTDVGLRGIPAEIVRRRGLKFVVLRAAGFGLDDDDKTGEHVPLAPWIAIDCPVRVASSLLGAGKEAALVG